MKLQELKDAGINIELLIEPLGIETTNCKLNIPLLILLIEPLGIETIMAKYPKFMITQLLIEPLGIETQ